MPYLHPHIIIDRKYRKKCTVGFACAGEDLSFHFFTLELPDRDNKQNVSCIPEGEYWVTRYHSHNKQTEVFQLEDVPDRTYIQMHNGRFTNQILGCILPGTAITHINDDDICDVDESPVVMDKLLKILPERFLIRITSDRTKENE